MEQRPEQSSVSEVKVEKEKMKREKERAEDHLQELRVDDLRRHSSSPSAAYHSSKEKMSGRRTDYVYVNSAYVGSRNTLNETRIPIPITQQSVVREQYWTCSKWSQGQKILAICVGLLAGTVVGLAVTMAVTGKDADDVIAGIFRNNMGVPD